MPATDTERLLLEMSAQINGFERALDRASGKFDKTARVIEARQRDLDRNLEKLGSSLGVGLGRASLLATTAFAAIIGYSVKAAASAVELQNAFEVAFGAGTKSAKDFAANLGDAVGRSTLEIQESMVRFRLLLKDQDAATADSLTKALESRAIDVGSLFNLKDADVIQKFFSGLSGESEPLKALGVNLNDAALKAELLRLGFKGTTQEASEQAKQIARANIIMRETAIAAGDAAKTLDSTANQAKKLAGETRDAAAAFGEQFLPIANKVLGWASDALKAFNDLPTGLQNAGLGMLALVAAGGPIASAIGGLAKLITYAREARAAMAVVNGANATGAAVAGAGAAAGVGGAVAAGAGVAVGVGAAAFGSAALMKNRGGDFARPYTDPKTGKKYTITAQGIAVPVRDTAPPRPAAPAAPGARTAEQTAAAANAAAATAAGGFTLSPDQLKVNKPGKTPEQLAAAARKAAAEREAAERKAEALRQQAFDRQARTADAVAAAEEDLLSIKVSSVTGARERLVLELAGIEQERVARRAELDLAVKQKDIEAPQRAQIDAAEEAVRIAREANLTRQAEQDALRERLDAERALADLANDVLQSEAPLARTAEDRRRIGLELLALQQAERRRALQAQRDDPRGTPESRSTATQVLGGLGPLESNERQGVLRSSMGPLEEWRDAAIQTSGEVREALESTAVRGLESFNSGIADAITGARSLGDVFGSGTLQTIAAFPSLHVGIMVTICLIVQYVGLARWIRVVSWVFLGLTVLATIYLGWHYFVDVIAGAAVGSVTVWAAALATGNHVGLRPRLAQESDELVDA